jgi:hypothetical protein
MVLFCCLTTVGFSQARNSSLGGAASGVELQVYPNPAVDYIQISFNPTIRQVRLFNLAGRNVRTYNYMADEQYFVGDLPKGMYLIQMIGEKNVPLATRRINIR